MTNPPRGQGGLEAIAHGDEPAVAVGCAARSLFLLFFRQIISRRYAWMTEILDHYQAVPIYNSGLLAASPLFFAVNDNPETLSPIWGEERVRGIQLYHNNTKKSTIYAFDIMWHRLSAMYAQHGFVASRRYIPGEIAYRPIAGGDKVLRVKMPGLHLNPPPSEPDGANG